jgi:hypothetical protein
MNKFIFFCFRFLYTYYYLLIITCHTKFGWQTPGATQNMFVHYYYEFCSLMANMDAFERRSFFVALTTTGATPRTGAATARAGTYCWRFSSLPSSWGNKWCEHSKKVNKAEVYIRLTKIQGRCLAKLADSGLFLAGILFFSPRPLILNVLPPVLNYLPHYCSSQEFPVWMIGKWGECLHDLCEPL